LTRELQEGDEDGHDVIPNGPEEDELGLSIGQIELHRALRSRQILLQIALSLGNQPLESFRFAPRLAGDI